jgi:hypothetical protein
MPPRRFPPPWSADETDACFIVRDHGSGANLRLEPGRRVAAKPLSRDEARRHLSRSSASSATPGRGHCPRGLPAVARRVSAGNTNRCACSRHASLSAHRSAKTARSSAERPPAVVVVGELEPAGVPQHVGMNGKCEFRSHASPGHHALISGYGQRCATFRDEDVRRSWCSAQELA